MAEFWETAFKEKQEMWGWDPAPSVTKAAELFISHKVQNILIPGFGYGRNAKLFIDQGLTVTGIEISKTAIDIAEKHFGDQVKIHHGGVEAMPFDLKQYDSLFSYSLLHLLKVDERRKFIANCYAQLKPQGLMIFVTISKNDFRYKQGKEVGIDTFEPWERLTLYFYDKDSIVKDFSIYGLIEFEETSEPLIEIKDKPSQKFHYIVCRKGKA